MSSILGAIFPVSTKNVRPLFDQNRNIFVKFTKFAKLGKGSKIVFYRARKLIGEGKIVRVERLDPRTAWIRYEKHIFLNQNEYNQYVERSPITGENRKMTVITVFVLEKLRRYKNPVKCRFTVTPSGRYLTKKIYRNIREK